MKNDPKSVYAHKLKGEKDVWFLTFFACVTARRARGDNILQLGCTGNSCFKHVANLLIQKTYLDLKFPNLQVDLR